VPLLLDTPVQKEKRGRETPTEEHREIFCKTVVNIGSGE
jgi:hypothetical protein